MANARSMMYYGTSERGNDEQKKRYRPAHKIPHVDIFGWPFLYRVKYIGFFGLTTLFKKFMSPLVTKVKYRITKGWMAAGTGCTLQRVGVSGMQQVRFV
jgi:hypothetical protein